MIPPFPIDPRRAAGVLALTAALAGCGGGGGVGSGGTGHEPTPPVFERAPIAGFGLVGNAPAIVVDGKALDQTQAIVTDDDGHVVDAADLKLGATVDVLGGTTADTADVATSIVVHTDLVGPVTTAFDAASGDLAVMGHRVRIDARTLLDAFPRGAAGIAAGDVVAVSALFDPVTGAYVATRIDPAAGADAYAVRGAVASLDLAGRAFSIGTQVFDFSSAAPPAALANGQVVRVRFLAAPGPDGRWIVESFGAGTTALPAGRAGDLVGVVDALADATHFTVAGVVVDASGAFIDPSAPAIAPGARVDVEGTMEGGTLLAASVEVIAADDDAPVAAGDTFVLEGPVVGSVDLTAGTFEMRGPTTIACAGAAFAGGTAADLVAGRAVAVTGALSADGTKLVASTVAIGP